MINFVLGAFVLLVIVLAMSIKILREYERAVVFFLGRFQRVFGPGLIVIIPGVQQLVRVDQGKVRDSITTKPARRRSKTLVWDCKPGFATFRHAQ